MAFDPNIGVAVCALLETNGGNLRKACRTLNLAPSTVLDWRKGDAAFAEQYARAREAGLQSLADEIVDIADGREPARLVVEDGHEVPALPDPQRDRLRVDTRKWLLSKCLPKLYGDKLTAELTGADGGPVEIVRRVIVDPKVPQQ